VLLAEELGSDPTAFESDVAWGATMMESAPSGLNLGELCDQMENRRWPEWPHLHKPDVPDANIIIKTSAVGFEQASKGQHVDEPLNKERSASS
jgi:hypothetical protein